MFVSRQLISYLVILCVCVPAVDEEAKGNKKINTWQVLAILFGFKQSFKSIKMMLLQ